MEYYYAQIDVNNAVIGVSQLSGEVIADHMIALLTYDLSILGSVYQTTDGTFVKPTPPAPTLDEVKSAKLAELAATRDAEIYTTFQSSALGTVKTYGYNAKAAENFAKETAILALNPMTDQVEWATIEDGFVWHTRAQFVQVINDGAAHDRNLQMQYWQLEAQVKSATTIDQVNAIVW